MKFALASLALLVCSALISADDAPKQWAVLVAGSNYYYNYRHQSDVCHAYQILHAHGIPDENIVVMMYDDIANNPSNPTKGVIVNHVDGADVYKGVPKDYVGSEVNVQNFINVLLGNEEAVKGKGSGKVIKSGPNDRVFINFVDHGATGLVAFPNDILTVQQLNDLLNKLHDQNKYKELVLYIEACESGSMFRNVLSDKLRIFATTASDYDESSYACYYDDKRGTYLGDVYSVNWMEDSDKENLGTETLQTQFTITKNLTTTSRCQEYGDLSLGNDHVSDFQGNKNSPAKATKKTPLGKVSPSWDVPKNIMHNKMEVAGSEEARNKIHRELDDLMTKRFHFDNVMAQIIRRVTVSAEQEQRVMMAKPRTLTNLDCHTDVVQTFHKKCVNLGQNTYALKYVYVLANMCEQGYPTANIIDIITAVCGRTRFQELII